MAREKSALTGPISQKNALEDLIVTVGVQQKHPAKTTFLAPGDILGGVYYIQKGRTRHYIVGVDGTEKVLYTLTAGWFFGESCLTMEEPTSLYSCTELDSVIYFIPRPEYLRLVDESSMFRNAILESYSNKMLILRHEIEELTCDSCKARLRRLLLSSVNAEAGAIDGWYGLKTTYTQNEMSAIVGGARVTINRTLKELCEEGSVRMLNRQLQVRATDYEDFVKSALS